MRAMPKVYRAMREAEGKPALGPRDLGVRTPPDSNADISPDAAGMVSPGTGGMSVSPSIVDLPLHRIPKRLRPLLQPHGLDATGKDDLHVWSMGEGTFVDGPVAGELMLRLDPRKSSHGFVEPDRVMALNDYEDALKVTRDQWRVDEVVSIE
jgi:hypothetical protein